MNQNIRLLESEENSTAKRRSPRKLCLAAIFALTIASIAVLAFFGPFRWTRGGIRLRGIPGPSTIKPRPEPLTDAEKVIAGKWSWSTGHAGSQLALAADGTFKVSGGACEGSGESQGTWRLEDKRLLLSRQSSYYRDYGETGPPYWEANEKTVEFWVVHWGQLTLLVESSDMDQFVQDINANCERGQGAHARYSRGRPDAQQVTGQPDLPRPWKDRLLPGEIRGKILEVLSGGRVRANIGSRDGVKGGMLLFIGGGTKAYPVNLRVLSVLETESTLEIASNDQKLKVEAGAAVSSHAYEFNADGSMVDR